MRAYATEVGLEPEEAVRRFVARYPDASIEEVPTPYVANPEKIVVDAEPAVGRLWRVVGWSLPLVLVIVYFGFGGRLTWWRPSAPAVAPRVEAQAEPSSSASTPVLTTPVAPTHPPTSAAGGPAQPPEPAASAPAPDGQFQIALAARGRCWVTIRSDGKIVFTGTLSPGERQELSVGGDVSLTVGNAGGIDLALNGKPARPLGSEGQVVTLRLTLASLDTFLVSR